MEDNHYRIKEETDEKLIKKQNDRYSFCLLLCSFFTFFFFNPLISVILSFVAILGYSRLREKNIFLIGHIIIVIIVILLIAQNFILYTK